MALLDDVKARLTDEFIAQHMTENPRCKKLQKDIDKSLKRRDYIKLKQYQAEMFALIDEVRDELANGILAAWEHDGTIVQHVSDHSALAYANMKNGIMICYEILQSITLDVKDWYAREGVRLNLEHVDTTDPISAAAKKLYGLLTKDIEMREGKFPPAVKELWTDEADRNYEYLKKRMEIFHRKLMRVMDKEDKIQKAS